MSYYRNKRAKLTAYNEEYELNGRAKNNTMHVPEWKLLHKVEQKKRLLSSEKTLRNFLRKKPRERIIENYDNFYDRKQQIKDVILEASPLTAYKQTGAHPNGPLGTDAACRQVHLHPMKFATAADTTSVRPYNLTIGTLNSASEFGIGTRASRIPDKMWPLGLESLRNQYKKMLVKKVSFTIAIEIDAGQTTAKGMRIWAHKLYNSNDPRGSIQTLVTAQADPNTKMLCLDATNNTGVIKPGPSVYKFYFELEMDKLMPPFDDSTAELELKTMEDFYVINTRNSTNKYDLYAQSSTDDLGPAFMLCMCDEDGAYTSNDEFHFDIQNMKYHCTFWEPYQYLPNNLTQAVQPAPWTNVTPSA